MASEADRVGLTPTGGTNSTLKYRNMIEFKKYNNILQFNYNEYRGKAGIYKITNKINNKCYIGQSINLAIRIRAHIRYIKRDSENQVIYRAIRKYGAENFYIEVLTILPPHEKLKQNLDLCEKIYIQAYDSYNNGYNSTLGGDGGMLGYHMTEQQKLNKSLAQKGKKKDPMIINHRAKTVYIYDLKTQYYFIASSSFDGSEIAKIYGVDLEPSDIQDCARGARKKSKNCVCAYSIEELFIKIEHTNERESKKTNRISGIA